MTDLIERDAILKKAFAVPGYFSALVSAWDIAKAPAVDAVQVVRCKECRYSCVSAYKYWCENQNTPFYRGYLPQVKADDFCSYGERRADNAAD